MSFESKYLEFSMIFKPTQEKQTNREFILEYVNFINEKRTPPSLLSPKTDGKLVRKPSNNIPKIILMIDDPVIDTPSCFTSLPKANGQFDTIWRDRYVDCFT